MNLVTGELYYDMSYKEVVQLITNMPITGSQVKVRRVSTNMSVLPIYWVHFAALVELTPLQKELL